ncbi:hypothetical protein M6B38_112715 [Iris pallida]|uniref:Uncharacterized protein n=1 Tax=Iris pallida TaxID=29817 RepID=A0AAX6DMW2_IRIPA|nr:hypothetical protein M6B38_112715 [Iris pallida]
MFSYLTRITHDCLVSLFIACASLFIVGIGGNISFCVTTPNTGIVDSLFVHFMYDEARPCRIDSLTHCIID